MNIGTDIIEIERIAKSKKNEAFLTKVFTVQELQYYGSKGERAETLAGMFAAKEAAAKALGCGFAGFRPSDIEVLHDEKGAPYLRFYHKACELLGNKKALVSISHCLTFATATCILFNGGEK